MIHNKQKGKLWRTLGFSAVCSSQICTAESWLSTEVEATQEVSVPRRLLPALSLLSPLEGMEVQQHLLSFASWPSLGSVLPALLRGPSSCLLGGREDVVFCPAVSRIGIFNVKMIRWGIINVLIAH